MSELISIEAVASKIFFIRSVKVMLDKDLAELYGVETRVLNQAVKRHKKRFPEDFMFQLSKSECDFLISQFVTSKKAGRGGARKMPYAFQILLSGCQEHSCGCPAKSICRRQFHYG